MWADTNMMRGVKILLIETNFDVDFSLFYLYN